MPSPSPVTRTDPRSTARTIYRVVTLAALPLAVWAVLPIEWMQRDPVYAISSLIGFGIPLVLMPVLAILALIGSVRLARDWRYALPAWLYVAGIGTVVVDLFVFSGEAGLWTPAGVLMAASLLAAAWTGWWLKV
jgi:hypothetical protein